MTEKSEIPNIPEEITVSPDERTARLEAWTALFKKIDSRIEVYLENTRSILNNVMPSGVRIDGTFSSPKLLVILPSEFGLSFLAGIGFDRMYSEVEVLGDEAYFSQDGDGFDCEPKTFPWEHFYVKLCEIANKLHNQIPIPPTGE